jgi:putative component of membrane protein insertase Oxa1/YidC/SpoIIIJ protein YidD
MTSAVWKKMAANMLLQKKMEIQHSNNKISKMDPSRCDFYPTCGKP